jgi:hypothetical protein
MAIQGSYAPMGDSRLFSLVLCHAHSAQIVEFSRWPASEAPAERLKRKMGSTDSPRILRELFIDAQRGAEFRLVSAFRQGNDWRKFPTAQPRLSKANVEICIFCVNLPWTFSAALLFILPESAENEGQSAFCFFPQETSWRRHP